MIVNGLRAGLLATSVPRTLQGGTRQGVDASQPDSFVSEIVIAPSSAVLGVSDTLQMSERSLFSGGQLEDRAGESLWSSSDPTVATVDENGLVEAIAPGIAVITALDGTTADNQRYAKATITVA